MNGDPVFYLQLRPGPGVDASRALRRLLKYGLRVCGLRCIAIIAGTADDGDDDLGCDHDRDHRWRPAAHMTTAHRFVRASAIEFAVGLLL